MTAPMVNGMVPKHGHIPASRDGRRLSALVAVPYATPDARWTYVGTFVTEISRDGDVASALALSPRPFPHVR